MSDHPDLLVLVRTLDPSAELGSTLELLTWIHATRPDLRVRLVSTRAGAWSARAEAVATVTVIDQTLAGTSARTLLKVGAAPAAQVVRSAGLRRELRTGSPTVLVNASAGGLLNWLDAGTGRVVAHLGRTGPHLEDLPDQDRQALHRRVTHWAEGIDLVPQIPDRDDQTGVTGRCRATLDRELGLAPGAPLVLMGSGPRDALPPDVLLELVWALVDANRGIRVLWATPTLQPRASALLAGHLADAGLHDVVVPIDASTQQWRRVAAADAVVVHADAGAAEGLGSVATHIAAHRTFTWNADDDTPDVPDCETISALLPGGPGWVPPTEEWHAATGGPAWLKLLGLDRPVA